MYMYICKADLSLRKPINNRKMSELHAEFRLTKVSDWEWSWEYYPPKKWSCWNLQYMYMYLTWPTCISDILMYSLYMYMYMYSILIL